MEKRRIVRLRKVRAPEPHPNTSIVPEGERRCVIRGNRTTREFKEGVGVDVCDEHGLWLDEDQLQPGIPWQPLLERGIKSSRSVAVLVGNDGVGPWEHEEMRAALQLAVKDGRPVIPVLLPGSRQWMQSAGWTATICSRVFAATC